MTEKKLTFTNKKHDLDDYKFSMIQNLIYIFDKSKYNSYANRFYFKVTRLFNYKAALTKSQFECGLHHYLVTIQGVHTQTEEWIYPSSQKKKRIDKPRLCTTLLSASSSCPLNYLPTAPRSGNPSPAPSLVRPPLPLRLHCRREESHAPSLLRPFSSNPAAEVPKEALELGMLVGNLAHGGDDGSVGGGIRRRQGAAGANAVQDFAQQEGAPAGPPFAFESVSHHIHLGIFLFSGILQCNISCLCSPTVLI
jgi:hypothetical protein